MTIESMESLARNRKIRRGNAMFKLWCLICAVGFFILPNWLIAILAFLIGAVVHAEFLLNELLLHREEQKGGGDE